MARSVYEGDQHFTGAVTFGGTVGLPSSSVTDAKIPAGAAIAHTKLQHQHPLTHYQTTGTAVVAATQDVYIARSAGGFVSFEAAVTGAIATGADRTVTIDLQKSTGGAAFASVLSATLVLDNTNTLRVLEAATLSTTTFADGDIIRITVAVAGAAGNQAQGLVATAHIWHDGV